MQLLSRFFVLLSTGLALVLPMTGEAADAEKSKGPDTGASSDSQPGSLKSIDEIARELSNPLATFYSIGYQFEQRSYQGSLPGASDQTMSSHILQSVIPFAQKNGKGFVFRSALPYIPDQPIYQVDKGYAEWLIRQVDPTTMGEGEWEDTHGHTDVVTFDLAYGGVSDTGLILQYGLAGELPTTSDTSNGKQQLILGPELNIGKMADWGVYGALVSHVFDVAEKTDKGTPDTSTTTIQAYFSYALSNGWQLISNPIISYDWEGDSGNKLAFPLGGGIAKTTRIGKMPLRVVAEVQKYVASTDRLGTDWLFKISITPIIPSKFNRH